jgi:hypothetical protein
MDVKASAVTRVIIAGEWIWVEPGTFTVQDFVFVDDHGNEIRRSSETAYHFVSTNGDPYFGPLSAIQLIKLRSPELDNETPEEPMSAPVESPPPAIEAEPAPSAESQSVADSLFSDPIPMPAGESPRTGGLL